MGNWCSKLWPTTTRPGTKEKAKEKAPEVPVKVTKETGGDQKVPIDGAADGGGVKEDLQEVPVTSAPPETGKGAVPEMNGGVPEPVDEADASSSGTKVVEEKVFTSSTVVTEPGHTKVVEQMTKTTKVSSSVVISEEVVFRDGQVVRRERKVLDGVDAGRDVSDLLKASFLQKSTLDAGMPSAGQMDGTEVPIKVDSGETECDARPNHDGSGTNAVMEVNGDGPSGGAEVVDPLPEVPPRADPEDNKGSRPVTPLKQESDESDQPPEEIDQNLTPDPPAQQPLEGLEPAEIRDPEGETAGLDVPKVEAASLDDAPQMDAETKEDPFTDHQLEQKV